MSPKRTNFFGSRWTTESHRSLGGRSTRHILAEEPHEFDDGDNVVSASRARYWDMLTRPRVHSASSIRKCTYLKSCRIKALSQSKLAHARDA